MLCLILKLWFVGQYALHFDPLGFANTYEYEIQELQGLLAIVFLSCGRCALTPIFTTSL